MKPLYSRFSRILLTAVLVITLNFSVKAQTTLVAGDIAFTGYQSATASADSFSFVLLRAITAGTVISFTDNGWLNPGQFRTGETHIAFTSIALPAGREITIQGGTGTGGTARQAGSGASAGTIAYTSGFNPLSFSTSGDQLIAYQGTIAAPTIISALHMNVYSGPLVPPFDCANTTAAVWDPDCIDGGSGTIGNTSFSKLPSGMITYINANWIGTEGVQASEQDNGRFDNLTNQLLGTAAQVRAAVNNPANWTTNNSNPPGFTLPSNFCFLGVCPLPVSLVSFTGKLNSDKTITLQWKVEAQQDIQEYIVEESADGITYRQSGSVAAGTGNTDTYSYIDMQVATGNNYYRLKTVELSGKIAYSDVIVVNLKSGIKVSVYPNPVTDKLTIQQFGTIQNKTAELLDGQGKILQQIKLTNLQQDLSIKGYPAGIYIVKMEDGTVFKIVKQ